MRTWKKVLAFVLSLTIVAGLGMAGAVDRSMWRGGEGETPTCPFEDVKGKDTTEAVARLYAAGIVKGTSDKTFEPNATLTRAEFMTLLGRAAFAEVDAAAETEFTDVVNDGWSNGYIAWGVENGLIQGHGNGTFGQYENVTEEQANIIIDRYNSKFDAKVPKFAAPSKDALRGSIAILLAAGFTYDYTEPVAVTGGEIRGYKSADGSIDVYKGIPYAANAGGENRWKAPQPVAEWDGVRDCVTWGASAIQGVQAPFMMWTTEYIIEDTGYSEDCLSLNVWTKGDETKDKPVIVYIHGGGLTSGGSSCEVYNGEYMASQDVVFVAINYRVGILGFMAHPELSAEQDGHSGNYGILDQIQALKWVQENIEKFGGDPKNVTIMGQSAGAMSVNSLVQSPLAAGLFTKAVAESGNTINMPHTPLATLEEKYAGLFEGKTLEELRAMPVEELLAVDNSGSTCVDDYVLVGQYTDTLAEGKVNDVSMMSGMVEDDTMLFGLVTSWFGINDAETYEGLVREKFGDLADKALELYPADENFAANCKQLNVDYMIAYQQIFSTLRAEKGESDTYLYHMTFVQANHDGGAFGAFHTSDVPYFLNIFSNHRADVWTEGDYEMGANMSAYLINFAKTGDPNGEGLVEWTPADGEGSYLNLDVPCESRTLSADKLALFNDLFSGKNVAE